METTYADMTQSCDMDLWVMKWRSAWPIFHGIVILPYILKTVWCMDMILSDYDSVCSDVWPQSKRRLLWPYISWSSDCALSHVRTSLFGIMNQYDPMHDLKINVGCCDLYFMVQWFCVISWRLFDVWTSSLGIIDQYDRTFDFRMNVCHCDIYFMVHWFCLIFQKTIWWMSVIFSDNEKVWSKPLPQNKYRSTWPVFHDLVILLNIFKII